jgi:endonuclease/exonuclease/phosphatase family metal-dependent hydrolase
MKLITWNIQWGRGADGRVDLGRIAAEIRRIADADVICLQEVSAGFAELAGNDGSDQFAALARLFPDHFAVTGAATDIPALQDSSRRRTFGNMILSRYPMLQVFRHLLPWPCDPGVMTMQRVAVEASLQTPAGLRRVTTTHLEYFSPLQRRAQVECLRNLHRDAATHARAPRVGQVSNGPFFSVPRGAASILTGDFNFRPDAPEHALMTEAIDDATPAYRDAWECLHAGHAHAPTVGMYDKAQWPGEPFTFDFMFVSEDLLPRLRRIEVDAVSQASDHQPVLLEID